eukprot:4892810-Amphidinium_carterae.1
MVNNDLPLGAACPLHKEKLRGQRPEAQPRACQQPKQDSDAQCAKDLQQLLHSEPPTPNSAWTRASFMPHPSKGSVKRRFDTVFLTLPVQLKLPQSLSRKAESKPVQLRLSAMSFKLRMGPRPPSSQNPFQLSWRGKLKSGKPTHTSARIKRERPCELSELYSWKRGWNCDGNRLRHVVFHSAQSIQIDLLEWQLWEELIVPHGAHMFFAPLRLQNGQLPMVLKSFWSVAFTFRAVAQQKELDW